MFPSISFIACSPNLLSGGYYGKIGKLPPVEKLDPASNSGLGGEVLGVNMSVCLVFIGRFG